VVQTAPGALYVGDTLQGEMDLLDALDWIGLNAKSGEKYTIALGKDEAITPTELSYGGKTLTISLKSAGGEHTVSFEGANPSYSLFNVKSGVTFTLEDGVTLRGTQNEADKSLIEVTGGRFVMNGGVITGNKRRDDGGGVYVKGTFTMSRGTINGNTAGHTGGGVRANTFTMRGGTISGNTAEGFYGGGGVYAKTFTKSGNGGIIYGSNAPGDQANRAERENNGHAVYIHDGGGLVSGSKKRNTTARAATAMDSAKNGPAGGWE
jgi:hypothetical protein